jgi:hypothetical protein
MLFRYVFRVRAIDESGVHSEWSKPLVAETDTADSAHKISFDEIECFEVLGEGAFSVVHRGTYKAQVPRPGCVIWPISRLRAGPSCGVIGGWRRGARGCAVEALPFAS